MTNKPASKNYDLEERTAKFGEEIIRMSAVAVPEMKDRARKLWQEAKELNLIFNSIYK